MYLFWRNVLLILVFPNTAGIDIGASSHWVAVPKREWEDTVREFGPMTDDLNRPGRLAAAESLTASLATVTETETGPIAATAVQITAPGASSGSKKEADGG
ncbi:hypothetical protein E4Q08_23055 [Candidatus Accumulibacter phosphatis]|jgi:hypothetical protein|uniref:Uncharacterized protein n=1 Tax=Candidatus Accumulibacter contiguus TaxID=2954381 RepID=A0ABX1TFT5_9PROT|nr:hypothetical protein [Candidatus Accumulibacter contiguus]